MRLINQRRGVILKREIAKAPLSTSNLVFENYLYLCKIMPLPMLRNTIKKNLSDCGFVGPNLLDWPVASPELNPIENYWSALKKELW